MRLKSRRLSHILAASLIALLFHAAPALRASAQPATPSPEAIAFFEKSIRPVLVEKCVSCHGPARQSGGPRLDSRSALVTGSDKGTVLDAANAGRSRLLNVLRYDGAVKMPPAGKLPDAVIADFAAWMKAGAEWPAEAGGIHAATMADRVVDARAHLWSLQPVRMPVLPSVRYSGWVKTPIDRFILAGLEAKRIPPAPPAGRAVWLRRATFDLIGLEPTPAEIAAFAADKSPGAYAAVIDRLLASPRYGERWGRHWLDLARYSDTVGYLVGNVGDPGRMYPYAYTYRDYVVRALNSDKPYDQFVKEQLAADLMNLPDKRDLAALGFLTVGNRYLGNDQEIIDDRIDVVTRGLQGMTVGCARCHDHKFDPIPSADYYSLYGVFNSIHEPPDLPQIGEPDDKTAYAAFLAKWTPLQQKLEGFEKSKNNAEANKVRDQIKQLVLSDPGAPPRAMVVADNDRPTEPRILLRGNPGTPGDPVKRQFLLAVLGDARKPFTQGSGRLELAQTIASPANPLTARVFVNRVWLHHFGRPLVSTPSDFGVRGTPPANPALLDYLAASFMQNGWSIKKLHRQIMLSSAYRQSCDGDPADLASDPENTLFGRMNRQRMEFEPLRDTLLQLSGALDTTLGGRPVQALFGDDKRRTLYAFVDRQDLPGVLRSFDFAEPGAHSPQRSVTTVPQQALFLMNNSFVRTQVHGLLARREVAGDADPAARIRELFLLIYGREPTKPEAAESLSFLAGWRPALQPNAAGGVAWQYGYGEVDPAAHRLKSFTKLPHFTGQNWQGGAQLPDPSLGWVLLNANGGHPGDSRHCAIRRWVAPRDMTVAIHSRLEHPVAAGDGVEAMILCSRVGLLANGVAHNSGVDINVASVEVRRGDTLDFVVSCRENFNSDSFQWAPAIEATAATSGHHSGESHWDATTDFTGPVAAEKTEPLTAWETYAQALLLTNEFLFID